MAPALTDSESKGSETSQISSEVAENYTVIQELGHGKFAKVSEVEHKETKKRFAWKQVVLTKGSRLEREVVVLQQMKHKNIVGLFDVYQENDTMDLMLELCKGSMSNYIQERFQRLGRARCYMKPSSWNIWSAINQLLTVVSFLHENQVAHRDIKPDNVLAASKGVWKLADFNLACEFKGHMTGRAGTVPFMAPEVSQGRYSEKCDIYSLGVLFTELVSGQPYEREKEDFGNVWKDEHKSALELVKKMLSPEADRYDAEEALKSPYMLQMTSENCCVIC